MTFNHNSWVQNLSLKIQETFKDRVLFIGFQGSYKRGEANEHSDVDMVVILDDLQISDLNRYQKIVQSMPYPEKACGFIGGKEEISNWPAGDVFQLLFDTLPIYGSLEKLVPQITEKDIQQFIKSSAANLYHATCHSYLYDTDIAASLAQLYKAVFYILQAIDYLNSNQFSTTKKELTQKLSGINKEIFDICLDKNLIPGYSPEQISKAYEALIKWCSLQLKEDKGITSQL